MLFETLLIVTLLAAGLFVISGMRARELAVLGSRNHCHQMGLQFLDQSVSLSRTRLQRNDRGQYGIVRQYHFEFTSTGEERYSGTVTMHNSKLEGIQLAPHRMPETNSLN